MQTPKKKRCYRATNSGGILQIGNVRFIDLERQMGFWLKLERRAANQ